jgi:plastocyanin
MRRALIACSVALALAGAVSAAPQAGQVREVSMPGKVFVPRTIQALVGDTVAWRNGDSSTHTVTANDDAFDSGFVDPGASYARTFTKPGSYAYHCTIHKFMRGVVTVVPVALSAPARPLSSGGRVVLQGLAPTGTQEVIVQRLGDQPQVVGRVTPAADGSFTLAVRVFAPASYRALVGGIASPTVRVAVAPLVAVQPGAGKLVADVRPSRAGARAVLQRYELERFAWRTLTRGVVDANSHVALPLPADRSGRFRVVVRGDGGWADGASAAVVLLGS